MAKGGETDTFEEHLRRYAMIVKTEETATLSSILARLLVREIPEV